MKCVNGKFRDVRKYQFIETTMKNEEMISASKMHVREGSLE